MPDQRNCRFHLSSIFLLRTGTENSPVEADFRPLEKRRLHTRQKYTQIYWQQKNICGKNDKAALFEPVPPVKQRYHH